MKKEKLLLIDSSALIYRAFYALPPLTDRRGRVVNAVYGFMSAFLNILKQADPTHVIFAFDSPKPTKRKEKYTEYKAHREKAPDELYAQIPLSKELVKNLGFTELEKAGFEADDIIATCAKKFLALRAEGEVVIATGDLDTLQLINAKTKVFALSRGVTESKIYDEKAVKERFGLEPHQMIDFKSLFGDASDNIKGVRGIGQKTASLLLQKFHTLEGIYKNLDKLKPKVKEALEKERGQALLSKELVTLRADLPLKLEWEEIQYLPERLAAGKNHLEDLSFNSLAKRVEAMVVPSSPAYRPPAGEAGTGRQFPVPSKDRIRSNDGHWGMGTKNIQFVTSQSDLEKQVISTTEKSNRLVLWSGETSNGKNLLIAPLEKNKVTGIFLMPIELAKSLNNSLFNGRRLFLFDLKEISKDIFPLKLPVKNVCDLKTLSYLIQPPLMRKFGLKEIVWHFLKERFEEPKKQMNLLGATERGYDREKVVEIIKLLAQLVPEVEETYTEQIKFQEQSPEPYGAGRGRFISVVFPAVEDKTKERSIEYVYKNIEKPLSRVLGLLEMAGVKIDLDLIKKLGAKNARDIDKLKDKIHRLAGKQFNLDSPSQLANILFEKLKITTEETKKGKAGHFSTAAGVLEKLKKKHPIISLLLLYREQRKFQTTYLEVIPELIDKNNNRLHTSFDQTGTATGRLSSNNPNLQNIPLQPISGEIGIRHAFIAEEGFKLISLDYSQIEIRLAAYLSGEEKLVKAFEKGRDIHRETAAFVNNVDPNKVDGNMRNAAKALNFGIIYGMSPFGFAAASKLSETEAKVFIDSYFRQFPNIARYINSIKEFAREYGFVETVFGRRRYVPEVNLDNHILRQAGERMAINMPLQGTAADIMKLALVETQKFLEEKYADPQKHPLERDARILLSIHDEIILEVRNNLVEKIAGEVKEIMENVAKDFIPLKVDVETGNNWGEI
ncbi:MAG: DNA polymerase I [Candidatus Moranbacteria bacterium]|nr:DNA polymerase I [Candidatus Moranbacteria bacterium]